MKRLQQNGASVIIMVLITFTVISMIVGVVVFRTLNNYHTLVQISSWQEALLAAESGNDTGMAALRATLSDSNNAWNGWSTADANGNTLANSGRTCAVSNITHTGEGNSQLNATVTVDAPAQLIDSSGRQWYRIRATGITYLPGNTKLIGPDKRDHLLRRLSLVWDRKTGTRVMQPQATRLIEVIAQPVAFQNALVAAGLIQLNNYNIVIDSYDSRDPSKSTNGSYDPAKFQQNGDVATDGNVIDAGNAYIYGDASTNAGAVINAAHVTGLQRTDFYQDLIPVQRPSWTVINGNYGDIVNNMTLVGGSQSNPQRYKLSSVKETGNNVLSLAPSAPGVESYVEIWITGDMNLQGNGEIELQPHVHAKIYVEGNMAINGNGFINDSSQAPYLEILGVHPDDGASRSVTLTGNGSFIGALYAPNADVVLSDGGTNGTYCGSIVAKTITMNNHTAVHYDEALGDAPFLTDYKIASWFEDNK